MRTADFKTHTHTNLLMKTATTMNQSGNQPNVPVLIGLIYNI